ncbi:TPA: hypothetical protein ACH3X1_016738 [Trebouxia sp. C0004]
MSLEAQGLPNGGAVGPAAASPLAGQSGHKRSHDGNGISNAKGKKQKRKEISKHAGSNSGGKTGKPFRPNGKKEWLIEKRLCLHLAISLFTVQKRKLGSLQLLCLLKLPSQQKASSTSVWWAGRRTCYSCSFRFWVVALPC